VALDDDDDEDDDKDRNGDEDGEDELEEIIRDHGEQFRELDEPTDLANESQLDFVDQIFEDEDEEQLTQWFGFCDLDNSVEYHKNFQSDVEFAFNVLYRDSPKNKIHSAYDTLLDEYTPAQLVKRCMDCFVPNFINFVGGRSWTTKGLQALECKELHNSLPPRAVCAGRRIRSRGGNELLWFDWNYTMSIPDAFQEYQDQFCTRRGLP
jgi:hypothetical protein